MNVADGSVRSPSIEAAQPGDLISIQWLLDLESLPSADLTQTSLEHFLVVRDDIGVIGSSASRCTERSRYFAPWSSPIRMPAGASGEGWSLRLNH